MKKTREELIAEYQAAPFEIGQDVILEWTKIEVYYETSGTGKKKIQVRKEREVSNSKWGKITGIESSLLIVDFQTSVRDFSEYMIGNSTYKIPASMFTKNTWRIGEDPFEPEIRLNTYNQDLRTLLYYRDKGINFDPFIIDVDGNKQYYQRGYVWTDDQKRALIDSIYKGQDIGRFILCYYTIDEMIASIEAGKQMDSFCVDGKQRMNAIFDFVDGKFCDSYGNYWDDLSGHAQIRFEQKNISISMPYRDDVNAAFIKHIFLAVNNTGTPVSKEHIDFVKSIKV